MSGHSVPVPSARAARRSTADSLDGKLDDAAWRATTPVNEFTQVDPAEGQPASERTEMRFLFDEGALYVGARMYDRDGRAGVRTSLVRRDASFNSDFMEIVIDGFHDHLGRAFWRKNESGGPNRFGHLEGLELGGQSGRQLELLPYVAAKNENLNVPNGGRVPLGVSSGLRDVCRLGARALRLAVTGRFSIQSRLQRNVRDRAG